MSSRSSYGLPTGLAVPEAAREGSSGGLFDGPSLGLPERLRRFPDFPQKPYKLSFLTFPTLTPNFPQLSRPAGRRGVRRAVMLHAGLFAPSTIAPKPMATAGRATRDAGGRIRIKPRAVKVDRVMKPRSMLPRSFSEAFHGGLSQSKS